MDLGELVSPGTSLREALALDDTIFTLKLTPNRADCLSILGIAREVGGTDLGGVLRTLSTLLREDARTRGEIEARQSWTIAAARMAVAAPWVTLALLSTRPEGMAAYQSALGAMVLIVAAVASVLAYRMMMAIGRLPVEPRLIT